MYIYTHTYIYMYNLIPLSHNSGVLAAPNVVLLYSSLMAWLSERTKYKLANSSCKIRLNPILETSIKILIQCSCVSEDTK